MEPEFYRKKLDNGLIVIFEKRHIPVVSSAACVKFGAQHESESIKGISHFVEHLVFKGTKKRTVQEIPKEIEDKGGIINAFTGEEITAYWNKLPSMHFETGADIAIDLALNPVFEKEALERERKVILEEIKMYHDNPSTYVMEKIKELMYKKPFNMSIAGTAKTVKGLSREKVIQLHDKIYTTNNMIFAVVGKTDFDAVLEQAKKFPNIRKEIKFIPIQTNNSEIIEKRKGIDQAHLILGRHAPKSGDKNRYSSEIFSNILGGGMSSKLFQEIREKRGLCYAIKSILEQSKDFAYDLVYAGVLKENVNETKKLILQEIKKMGSLTQKELDEAKERLIGLRQVNKEKCDATMVELIAEELAGNAEEYYDYEKKINSVKLDDVRGLSKLKGYSFVALVPD